MHLLPICSLIHKIYLGNGYRSYSVGFGVMDGLLAVPERAVAADPEAGRTDGEKASNGDNFLQP